MATGKKKSKKFWKVLLIIVLVPAAVLVGARLFFRLPVSGYYKASTAAFAIPGLSDGYVPQGLEYRADNNTFLLTGYQKDGGASPVYVVDRATGETLKKVTLKTAEGDVIASHSGGLAAHNGLLYVCDGGIDGLRVFSLADLDATEDGGVLTETGTVSLSAGGDHIGPAFVTAGPEGLVVGEFYIAVHYETPKSHYVGDHHSLALLLPYDESDPTGVAAPTVAYSIPDLAQGMCFDGDGMTYVSESWGVSFSKIEVFAPGKPIGEIAVLGKTLPLTVLDESNRVSVAKLPPMSEEIVILDGKLLYTNCESASQKYYFGLLTGGRSLYGTELDYVLADTKKG